jgi:hypothetical protein
MIKLANPLVKDPVITTTTNLQQWAYSLGNLGRSIPYQAVGAVLLFFYVDIQKLHPSGQRFQSSRTLIIPHLCSLLRFSTIPPKKERIHHDRKSKILDS